MTIAVTGSSGFIGSHLLPALHDQGHEVLEISRKKGSDITKWEEVKDLPSFDVIVHLAAKSFVPDSFQHPWEFYYTNQTSTLNALELGRKRGARMIYVSSYLYGPPQYLPVDEKHPLAPHNPYAQTKIICEKLCEGYHRDFKIPVTIFRPFNIYGPGQKKPFLIPTILEQAKTGSVHLKDPRPKRDYIHVEDVVGAILKAVEIEGKALDKFNLGSGISRSVEEIVSFFVQNCTGVIDVSYTHEYRQGEVLDTVADVTSVKDNLGWQPRIEVEEGIRALLKDMSS